jgi:hypothetical protein
VVLMNPDHFVGYFNVACVHGLRGEFGAALDELEQILANERATASVRETLEALHHDPDFGALLAQADARQRFREIERVLFPDISDEEWGTHQDTQYYTV